MNLVELKRKSIKELLELAAELRLDGGSALRRQDLILALVNAHASGTNAVPIQMP